MPYPSPPAHGIHRAEFLPPGAITYDFPSRSAGSYCWEAASDPGDPWMGAVFRWVAPDGTAYGYQPYCYESSDAASALRYLQAAVWYAARLGLPPA